MALFYNLLLALLLVLALPFAVPWLLFSRRAREGLVERLTPLSASPADVWLHAASVGETRAAAPLLVGLRERAISTVVTTQTPAGRDVLQSELPQVPARLAPLDVPPLARWSFARVHPKLLVLIETELWPNLIWAARASGARVLLLSARISDRSFPRYRRIAPLIRPLLEQIELIAARGETDAARLIELGAPKERVQVVGDLKLDRDPPDAPSANLLRAVGPGPLLVAGSTHPGEEEGLLEAFLELRRSASGLRLVLAPRHVRRAPGVLRLAERHGLHAGLRSQGAEQAEVVILDTTGELASLYSVAELVFCGGSLVPVGGHNLLEPVQAGKVVVHGPHVHNQRPQVELLEPYGVLYRVGSAGALHAELERLWHQKDRHRPAREAGAALASHRGAARRCLELVLKSLSRADGTHA
ncbi:MAG: glycosyltransferase N-terminal domain-containing protein [Myxococcota bacterium]